MSDQPVMTLEEVKASLSYLLEVIEDNLEVLLEHPECTSEITSCRRQSLAVTSALHYLESGKQDIERVDYLNSKECRVQWIDNAINVEPENFRRLVDEVMKDTALSPTPTQQA